MELLAKLSVFGLYQHDQTIFDGLTMPGELSKDDFIALVFQECAELPVSYPDPDVFKVILSAWSNRHQKNWTDIYNTTIVEYNPIENYDRIEEWEDEGETEGEDHNTLTRTGDVTTRDTGGVTVDHTGGNTTKDTGDITTEIDETHERSETSFNNNDYSNTEKNTADDETKVTNNLTTEYTQAIQDKTENDLTNLVTNNLTDQSDGNDKRKNKTKHTGRVHGNIGVTTTQQMLQSSRDIAKYNVYTEMLNDYMDVFCVRLY